MRRNLRREFIQQTDLLADLVALPGTREGRALAKMLASDLAAEMEAVVLSPSRDPKDLTQDPLYRSGFAAGLAYVLSISDQAQALLANRNARA